MVAFLRFLGAVPPAVPFKFPCAPASSAFRLCELSFVALVGLPGVVDVCARGLPARPPLGWSRGTFGLVARFATNECPLCDGTGDVGRDPDPPGAGVFTCAFGWAVPLLDVVGCCDPGRGGGASIAGPVYI